MPLLLFASAEAKTSLFLARGAHRAPVAAFTNRRNNFIPTEFVAQRDRHLRSA